jgi:hypothetical protein
LGAETDSLVPCCKSTKTKSPELPVKWVVGHASGSIGVGMVGPFHSKFASKSFAETRKMRRVERFGGKTQFSSKKINGNSVLVSFVEIS